MEITGRGVEKKNGTIWLSPTPGYRPCHLSEREENEAGRTRSDGIRNQFDHYHFGAAVHGKGKYGDYFDGKIDDFELHNRPFDEEEIKRLSQGILQRFLGCLQ